MLSQPLHSQLSAPSTPSSHPTTQALDPRRILDMNYAFVSTAMLVAAVRLRLFTCIAHNALTPDAFAELTHMMAESMERLLKQ